MMTVSRPVADDLAEIVELLNAITPKVAALVQGAQQARAQFDEMAIEHATFMEAAIEDRERAEGTIATSQVQIDTENEEWKTRERRYLKVIESLTRNLVRVVGG
jgi:hypothetical protein